MLRRLGLLALFVCAGVPARAQAPAPSHAVLLTLTPQELKARVLTLLHEQPHEQVRAPLDLAKRSLAQAEAAQAAHDEARAQRAVSAARAALGLAEARANLLRERALLEQARRQQQRSRQRLTQSQLLADKARERLAQLAADASAAPSSADAGASLSDDAGAAP